MARHAGKMAGGQQPGVHADEGIPGKLRGFRRRRFLDDPGEPPGMVGGDQGERVDPFGRNVPFTHQACLAKSEEPGSGQASQGTERVEG